MLLLKRYSAILFITLLFTACSEYQKVLNKGESTAQYKLATDLYEAGEYKKAENLFEKVIPLYGGKPQMERIQYMYSDCLYKTKQYKTAEYHYNRFIGNYPNSSKIEEATYMAAMSFYNISPKSSLDQSYTQQALIAFQRYIDKYPESPKVEQANKYYDELNDRLELKYFNIAKQYYHTEQYRAAIASFDTFIEDNFGTYLKEDAIYYKFKAANDLAMKSVLQRKVERIDFALTVYDKFKKSFPESEKMKDMDDFHSKLTKELALTQELLDKFKNNGL